MTSSLPTIGICGAGQMGAAAAVSFRRAGFPVLLGEHNAAKVPEVHQRLADLEAWMNQHVEARPALSASIEVTQDLGVIDERADVIMDAIVEVLEEKVALLRRMSAARSRGAVFLSTTSGLPITQLARDSGVGRLLVGTHFWNPPHLMPLVEVVRGAESDPALVDRVCDLMQRIGKIPVRVEKDVPGFIGNRLLHALWREAIYLVEQGIASPEDIDRVARLTFSLRMPAVGPLENMDLVGLDLIKMIHHYLPDDLCNEGGPRPLLEQMVREGTTFHDWAPDGLSQLAERRDRQIVHQLAFLKETDAL